MYKAKFPVQQRPIQGPKTNDSQALSIDLETGCHQGTWGSLVEKGSLLGDLTLSAQHRDYRCVSLSLVFLQGFWGWNSYLLGTDCLMEPSPSLGYAVLLKSCWSRGAGNVAQCGVLALACEVLGPVPNANSSSSAMLSVAACLYSRSFWIRQP